MEVPGAEPTALVTRRVLTAIFFPPLSVIQSAGYERDLWFSIIFTILGFIPGVIHAFFLLHVYYLRRSLLVRGRLNEYDPPPHRFVWSPFILRGDHQELPPKIRIPGPPLVGPYESAFPMEAAVRRYLARPPPQPFFRLSPPRGWPTEPVPKSMTGTVGIELDDLSTVFGPGASSSGGNNGSSSGGYNGSSSGDHIGSSSGDNIGSSSRATNGIPRFMGFWSRGLDTTSSPGSSRDSNSDSNRSSVNGEGVSGDAVTENTIFSDDSEDN